MNAAIVGGRLQGLEACYLARKAGWSTLLIDKRTRIPAYRLCDHFLQLDIAGWKDRLTDLQNIDCLIPAVENPAALQASAELGDRLGVPCLYAPEAYSVSSSKSRSYALLEEIGVSVPQKWPECGFPLLVRPDGESGSHQVQVHSEPSQELARLLQGAGWVAERYIPGPLYSLEVIGVPGSYDTIQVTDLVVDSLFDCQRVLAPSRLAPQAAAGFHEQAKRIAEAVRLHGVMDVEAIGSGGELIAIEIDARLPSQTPTAVFWSTQCNILERWAQCFSRDAKEPLPTVAGSHVIYEHIEVKDRSLFFRGERCIARRSDLELIPGFYGADEAITDVGSDVSDWAATLIFAAPSREEVRQKRLRFYERIIPAFGLDRGSRAWADRLGCE